MNDKINISQEIIGKYKHLGLNQDNLKVLIDQYNKYIASIVDKRNYNYKNIQNCSKHRVKMVDKGKRPPCHACKYVKRSMNIFMDYMFVNKRDALKEDRLEFLLRNSFFDKLRTTRVNHMRLLASNIASMGNIMFSCADSPMFSFDTIEYIAKILGNGNDKCKDETTQEHIKKTDWTTIGRIDKALLYHLIAFRYYSIAKLDKDASDCLLKILIIINNALTVAKHNPEYVDILDNTEAKNNYKLLVNDESYRQLKNLFDTLFTRYAKLVNRQCGYSEYSEVQDIRQILHMHEDEDINFTRSHQYSELIESIWHIIDSEVKMLEVVKAQGIDKIAIPKDAKNKENVNNIRIKIITDAYNHFNYICMPHNTFYNEVIFYYAKFTINNYILNDILEFAKCNKTDNGDDPKDKKTEILFLQNYRRYLTSQGYSYPYDSLFHISDTCNKQDFIEFIIEDSIICLSEILYKLTPFNHISSFSNNFVAEIYNHLWRYAKMYETLGRLYDYNNYPDKYELLFEYLKKFPSSAKTPDLGIELKESRPFVKEGANLKDKYGSLRNRMFTRLKHNIDDRTFKYTISYHAAEMALRYYALMESGYSEGDSYRNQLSRNYLLNDDLDNDTWLFNTAIERFRINTNDIERRKKTLVEAITDSRFYKYESYVMEKNQETEQFDFFDDIRFEDSLFTNTEL